MQGCNIAEAHNPFGTAQQRCKVELIDNTGGAKAATGANNTPHRLVVERPLKIGTTLFVCAGQIRVPVAEQRGRYNDLEAPALQNACGKCHAVTVDLAAGARNRYSIARAKWRWLYHALK